MRVVRKKWERDRAEQRDLIRQNMRKTVCKGCGAIFEYLPIAPKSWRVYCDRCSIDRRKRGESVTTSADLDSAPEKEQKTIDARN